MRIAWATDLHFDQCDAQSIEIFLNELNQLNADCFLFAGDLSDGLFFESHLQLINSRLSCPFYFVLGNHDYYYRSIDGVQKQLAALNAKKNSNLFYLPHLNVISLKSKVALIGHDGWADGLVGHFHATPIQINDYRYIDDFKNLSLSQRAQKIKKLGEQAAALLFNKMLEAFQFHDQIIILTHVPPFEEAALYKGQSDKLWSPFMVCKAAGEAIKEVLTKHPEKNSVILCGHSHSPFDRMVLPNLRIVVGKVQQGVPSLQQAIIT